MQYIKPSQAKKSHKTRELKQVYAVHTMTKVFFISIIIAVFENDINAHVSTYIITTTNSNHPFESSMSNAPFPNGFGDKLAINNKYVVPINNAKHDTNTALLFINVFGKYPDITAAIGFVNVEIVVAYTYVLLL